MEGIVRVKYLVGQAVFAKIKGYPPWPSIITEIPRNGLVKVLYFNSSEYSVLSEKRIKPIQAGGDIVKKYKGNKAFTKALAEMNAVLKIETPKTTPKKEPKKTPKKTTKNTTKNTPKITPKKDFILRIKMLSRDEIGEIQKSLKAQHPKRKLRAGRCY